MVFWIAGLTAALLALFLMLVPGRMWRNRGRWEEPVSLFLVLFLGMWAALAWLPPMGPRLWGVSWLAALTVGAVVLILMASSVNPPPESGKLPDPSAAEMIDRRDSRAILWTLLTMLALLLIGGYAR